MPTRHDAAKPIEQALRIFEAKDAASYAAELFRESFHAPFPIPRDNCGLAIPTPPQNWRQYVAVYTWPDGRDETVGFCNWIRHEDVYLEGGMCAKSSFYRRMPREHFRECQAQGGIAQMMMAAAARDLDDCKAWFGYCGDAKAMAVDLRAGYVPTEHRHLIVKWFKPNLTEAEKNGLVASIAAIGPF